MNIVQAIYSEEIFRPFFKDLKTWGPWITLFKVLSGYKKLDEKEMELFQECTGLEELPKEPLKEIFIVAGRRSGKSTGAALLSAFFGVWGDWKKYLSPGETARTFIVATNKQQGKIIMNYISAIFNINSSLRRLVKKQLAESIELTNGLIIEIKPASWRSSRGYTVGPLFIMEELAFWRFETESATRDKEIYTAIKPGMTTIKNGLVIGLSTPFARQGLLWEKFNNHFGKPGPVLIWRAPTWRLNLTLSKEELEKEYLESLGEAEFGAEYAARFREDIEAYLPVEIYDRAVVKGRTILAEQPGVRYAAFCDPSEGLRKGGDSMTFAIAHAEKEDGQEKYILDVLMEFRPPFNPAQVIDSITATCKRYGIQKIVQDRHAIAWIAKDFKSHNIEVEISDETKSQIYELFAVEMNKGRVVLLDNERLRSQTLGLQRFLKGGGFVKIDHYRGGRDDCVNSVAGVCGLLSKAKKRKRGRVHYKGLEKTEPEGEEHPGPAIKKGRVHYLRTSPSRNITLEQKIRETLRREKT